MSFAGAEKLPSSDFKRVQVCTRRSAPLSDQVGSLCPWRRGGNVVHTVALLLIIATTAWPGGVLGGEMRPAQLTVDAEEVCAGSPIHVTFLAEEGGTTSADGIVFMFPQGRFTGCLLPLEHAAT
jgi:hypothetical protein